MQNRPDRGWLSARIRRSRRTLGIFFFTAAVALAQTAPRPANFDIRSLQRRMNPPGAGTDDATRQAQIVPLQARLAAATTETGGPLRYSLNSQGRLKLLAAQSGALTAPSADAAEAIAAAWLEQHRDLFDISAQQIAAAENRTQQTSTGLRFVEFERTVDGLPIFRSNIRIGVDQLGRIVQVQGGEDPPVIALVPSVDAGPEAAIAAAFRALAIDIAAPPQPLASANSVWMHFSNPESELDPAILVRKVAFPFGPGSARATYRINAVTSKGGYDILVSADNGQLLYRVDLQAHLGQARVWAKTPIDGPRELVDLPDGWLPPGGTTTKGNNADSYLDANGDGKPDNVNRDGLQAGRAFNDSQIFDFPAGDGFGPPSDFRAQAVAQAFYHLNIAHDYFYELGFREKDGNFQTDNLGKGGKGGDAVLVHVQTSDEPNNASFEALADGIPGKMYLGIYSFPDGSFRDAALSGEIVLHEYVHGVTDRIIGGPQESSCLFTGAQNQALGEAWSDYFAASFYETPLIGAYDAELQGQGLRRFPLNETPWKYYDLGNDGLQQHNDGEIFAAVLWDIRQQLGVETADALVFKALALTPCEPSFLDARDAILLADQTFNAGANRAALWVIFAARGMGFGSGGGDQDYDPLVTRFDSTAAIPAEFGGVNFPPKVTSQPSGYAIVGENAFYTILAEDPEGDAWTVEMLEAPSTAQFDPVQRRVRWRPTFTEGRFVFAVTDSHGNQTKHGFVWLTFSIITLQNSLSISGPAGSLGVAGFIVDDQMSLLQVTLRDGHGDPNLTVWPPLFGEFSSFNIGPDETLSIPNPRIGIWYVFVDGSSDYGGVRLRAREVKPTVLALDVPKPNLSDNETGERIYLLNVPTNTKRIRVQLHGGSGEADLLAAHGRIPTCPILASSFCDFDEISTILGTNKAIELANPKAGDWYFNVSAFSAYHGVTLKASTATAPSVAAATDGAAFTKRIAPGGISTLFGEGFTAPGAEAAASTVPLPTELAGVEVFVDGVAAPLFYASEKQINFQNPFESIFDTADVVVVQDGQVSTAFSATVDPNVPRLFAFFQGAQQEPVITHADGSVVTPENPAKPGEILIAYLTGVGDLNNPPATGAPAGSDPLTTTLDVPTVIVNGIEVTAEFSGWTPAFVSLLQVNFRLPASLPPGERATIKLRYGNQSTQQLTLSIE